ncbi:MAG: hypothetical protein QW228_05685 [Candidatus Aenigmatarchaeota archaeon]
MRKNEKKGETLHHCFYHPEIVVKLPNKATHLVITAFQSMKDKEKKRRYLIETIFALISELWKEVNNYQDKKSAK